MVILDIWTMSDDEIDAMRDAYNHTTPKTGDRHIMTATLWAVGLALYAVLLIGNKWRR